MTPGQKAKRPASSKTRLTHTLSAGCASNACGVLSVIARVAGARAKVRLVGAVGTGAADAVELVVARFARETGIAVYAVHVNEVVQNDGGSLFCIQSKESVHPGKILYVLPARCAKALNVLRSLCVPKTGSARSPRRRGGVQARVCAVA